MMRDPGDLGLGISGNSYRSEGGTPEVQAGYDRSQLAVGSLGGGDTIRPAAEVSRTDVFVSLADDKVFGNFRLSAVAPQDSPQYLGSGPVGRGYGCDSLDSGDVTVSGISSSPDAACPAATVGSLNSSPTLPVDSFLGSADFQMRGRPAGEAKFLGTTTLVDSGRPKTPFAE